MKNLFLHFVSLLAAVSFVAEGSISKQKTTKSGATFTLMSRDELKALGLEVSEFLGHDEGEAWRAPDRVKQVGATLVQEGTASTLKYTGVEIYSGTIWGDMALEKDGAPRLFKKVEDAVSYCKKIGARLPTAEDYITLRNHLGARWDNSWGKLYSNTNGYSPEILPNLTYSKTLAGDITIREQRCYLAQGGMIGYPHGEAIFNSGNGVLTAGYCESGYRPGYEVRCVLDGTFKESHGNPKTKAFAGVGSIEDISGSPNYKERYYGYTDANLPHSTPIQYAKKSFGEATSESDYWALPNRGDASRMGDRHPYIYQPRSSYEYNSVSPRRYKN